MVAFGVRLSVSEFWVLAALLLIKFHPLVLLPEGMPEVHPQTYTSRDP